MDYRPKSFSCDMCLNHVLCSQLQLNRMVQSSVEQPAVGVQAQIDDMRSEGLKLKVAIPTDSAVCISCSTACAAYSTAYTT